MAKQEVVIIQEKKAIFKKQGTNRQMTVPTVMREFLSLPDETTMRVRSAMINDERVLIVDEVK